MRVRQAHFGCPQNLANPMSKFLKTLFVASLLFTVATFVFRTDSVSAQTGPGVYTWAYSHTNIYANQPVVYEFASLDTTVVYEWFFAKASIVDGSPTETIGIVTGTGSATQTFAFGTTGTFGRWPTDYLGPVVVYDNYGNTLGQHFLAPSVENAVTPTDWETTSGNNNEAAKQSPGVLSANSPCQHPAYRPINPDGWHHSYRACNVQIDANSYWVFHYRTNAANYGVHNRIKFYEMPGTTEVLDFDLDDMVDWQDGGWTTGLTDLHYKSYIVISNTGESPPFYDANRQSTLSVSGLNDPLATPFGLGAYNCQRQTAAASFITDCESVLLVSNVAPNLTFDEQLGTANFDSAQLNEEWIMQVTNDPITVSTRQTIVFTQFTEEIWDVYHGVYDLTHDDLGTLDTTVYGFSENRLFQYTTTGNARTNLLAFEVDATGINAGLATTAEMVFFVTDLYESEATAAVVQLIDQKIEDWGLDTDFGSGAALLFLLMLGLVTVGSFSLSFKLPFMMHLILQMFVYLAIGGWWILEGHATRLIALVFIATTVLMFVVLFMLIAAMRSRGVMVDE